MSLTTWNLINEPKQNGSSSSQFRWLGPSLTGIKILSIEAMRIISIKFQQCSYYSFQHRQRETIQSAANTIAHEARKLSNDPEYMSPFCKAAANNGYQIKGKYFFPAVSMVIEVMLQLHYISMYIICFRVTFIFQLGGLHVNSYLCSFQLNHIVLIAVPLSPSICKFHCNCILCSVVIVGYVNYCNSV